MNRDDIQTEKELLKQEVLDEIKKRKFKQEIVDELQKSDKVFRFSAFAQHPATLLITGFVLTGIVGTLLTTRWQRKEWDRQQQSQSLEWSRQQSRLIQIHNIDHKYEVIDEITKAVGESNAAASDILFTFNAKAMNLPELKGKEGRIKLWHQADQSWQKNISVIAQKLNVFFKDPQFQDELQKIIDKRDLIFFNLLELIDRAAENPREIETEDFKGIAQKTKLLINLRSEDLQQLVNLMIKEIEADAEHTN